MVRAPVPDREVDVLKALLLGACALMLLIAAPATDAASKAEMRLKAEVERHARSVERDQQVLRFFNNHPWLLSVPQFAAEARHQVETHRAHLVLTMRRLSATRAALVRQTSASRYVVARAQTPRAVICRVFGSYCAQALTVARCESNLSTTAQNGQYLGLFQMGWSERRLFGHGAGVEAQARAAHRYFVRSGRDWSPWPTCGRYVQ